MTKPMTKSMQADSLFQVWLKTYADAFGIEKPELLEPQRREIIPEFVQIDSVVTFSDDFDFTKLADLVFPFLGKENVIEYKGENDDLLLAHLYQYSLTELGLITTHCLTRKPEKRKDRVSLSQRGATTQWQQLKAQGAKHTCCTVIVSTGDPVGLRKEFGFEPIEEYEHLSGALHRLIISENKFVGSLATYIVVLNELPMHPKNAPLLLLSTGKKRLEFLDWLLKTHNELTLQQKDEYLFYLVKYNLIENKEILQKMSKNIKSGVNTTAFYLLDAMVRRQKYPGKFFEELVEKYLALDPSEIPTTLTLLSSEEKVQEPLQADTPEEAALQFIESEDQIDRLRDLFRKRNSEKHNREVLESN